MPTFLLSLIFLSVFPWVSVARLTGFDIPFARSIGKRAGQTLKRGDVSGSIGLGDNADLLYTVPVEIGSTVTAVHLDTGSSDLWVITDQCRGGTCTAATAARYPSSTLQLAGTDVAMYYGDSTTGTNATGAVALDTVAIAGVAIEKQAFAAVDYTSNPTVNYGAAGIFGLGFPSGSSVQQAVVLHEFGQIKTIDSFVASTYATGPTLARIAMTNELENPMFSISLQRDTIDIGGGTGTLTIGKLPDGVDMKSVTWVPVRLYSQPEGGLTPPTFAPNEVYPFRWEIDIDGVYLNGQKLPDSTIPASDGVNGTRTSALIDTGNSLLRGPADVVQNILGTVSGKADGTLPCATPVHLSFMIGGKMFPIDPRDFIGQHIVNDATTCIADNIVSTDPPGFGGLFRWSLGDPFFKSNLVAFHYGNLTNPSVDPPKIGLLSMVPTNADALLQQAVQDAKNNGGNFESSLVLAPTAQAASEGETTVSPQTFNTAPSTFATSPVANTQPPRRTGVSGDAANNGSVRNRTCGVLAYSIIPLVFVMSGMFSL